MNPTSFKEHNAVLRKPASMTDFERLSEVHFDVNDFHKYSYKDLIPEGFSKGYVHDMALAATILCAEGRKQGIPYITEWELDQVAKWVASINPRICYEVSRSCKEIAKNEAQ